MKNTDSPGVNLTATATSAVDNVTLHQLLGFITDQFSNATHGILLAGSRIYGSPHEESDLDVIVALSKPVRKRIVRKIGNLFTDISALFSGEIRRSFQQPHAPGILECMARGSIIFDRDGLMRELKALAKAIYSDGPPPLGLSLLASIRASLTNELFRSRS